MKAITYLYGKGHNTPDVVHDAFVKAACYGRTKIVAFLPGAKPLSSDTVDQAFECAAAAGVIDIVNFLYEQHRVSRASLNEVFECTRSAAVIGLLHSEEKIPVVSIVAAFINAARCGYIGGQYYHPHEDQLKILEVLIRENCIPAELINEVAVRATREFQASILQI